MTRFFTHLASPIGPILATSDGDAVTGLYTAEHARAAAPDAAWTDDARPFAALRTALATYFAGARAPFDDVVRAAGGTPFERDVWRALAEIPFGTTIAYAELARRVGRPRAVRAVGAANGKNPISIVVPCHRVVGSNGALTGYAGGIAAKRWLLAHERAALACAPPAPAPRHSTPT